MKKAKEAAGDKWNQEEWEKDWRTVYLIPVAITYDTTSSSTSQTMTGIQNDLQPGYAKLKGGPEGDVLELEVTYTTFNNKLLLKISKGTKKPSALFERKAFYLMYFLLRRKTTWQFPSWLLWLSSQQVSFQLFSL